jgi:hypothetical protein
MAAGFLARFDPGTSRILYKILYWMSNLELHNSQIVVRRQQLSKAPPFQVYFARVEIITAGQLS